MTNWLKFLLSFLLLFTVKFGTGARFRDATRSVSWAISPPVRFWCGTQSRPALILRLVFEFWTWRCIIVWSIVISFGILRNWNMSRLSRWLRTFCIAAPMIILYVSWRCRTRCSRHFQWYSSIHWVATWTCPSFRIYVDAYCRDRCQSMSWPVCQCRHKCSSISPLSVNWYFKARQIVALVLALNPVLETKEG